MSIQIGKRIIGKEAEPFIIAEMSGNHNQSLHRALEIVDKAAECGADAIKLQTYTADTMTLDIKGKNFDVNDPKSPWKGENLHNLYKKAYTPWEWHKPIMERAKEKGLICFSSPFDESAVDFLEKLEMPAYKIASFENNHLPLIRKAAATQKPLIISTGMATLAELEKAVNEARAYGCKELMLLKCTSTYPANEKNSNIKTIPHMKELFDCEVGLSDHTLGIGVGIASIALGATTIEKHFTLARKDGGVDSTFSLEPSELKMLCEEAKRAWHALGTIKYGITADEEKSLVFRRSIYVSEDINEGGIFTKNNIRIIRPGDGASPELYDSLIGKKAKQKFKKGDPLSLNKLL